MKAKRIFAVLLAVLMVSAMIVPSSAGTLVSSTAETQKQEVGELVVDSCVIIDDVIEANYTFVSSTAEELILLDTNAGFSTNIPYSHIHDKKAAGDGTWYGRNDGTTVYRYAIPADAVNMVWRARLGGGYKVEVAIGAETAYSENSLTWTQVALYSEDGLNGTDGVTDKGITCDVSKVDHSAGDQYIYLKISHSGSGWGARICLGTNYPITMSCVSSDSSEKELSRVIIDDVTPAAGTGYTFAETEPMLVPEATDSIFSADLSAGENGKLAGDGCWNSRYGNTATVYRYKMKNISNQMVWSARLGGAYRVDLAIGEETYSDDLKWETVALCSQDGLNGQNNVKDIKIAYDLSGVDNSAEDKYIYIKISKDTGVSGGWDARICLGTYYPITMSYGVSTPAPTYTYIEDSCVVSNDVIANGDGTYKLVGGEPMLYYSANTEWDLSSVASEYVVNGVYTGEGEASIYWGRTSDAGHFIYRYKLASGAKAAQWSATLGGGYRVDYAVTSGEAPAEGSGDWKNISIYNKDIFNEEDGTVMNGTSDAKARTLTMLLPEDIDYGTNQYIYIKISKADDGHWGGRVLLGTANPITMSYGFAGLPSSCVMEDSRVVIDDVTPVSDTAYTFAETEPMLVSEVTDSRVSVDLPAGVNGKLIGDGCWNSRFGGTTTVYRYKMNNISNQMVWSARLGGAYRVDLAIGGEAYSDSLVWETVALCSEDSVNSRGEFLTDLGFGYPLNIGQGAVIDKTITYDLSGVDNSAGDKYIYIKISQDTAVSGGWDARICLGTNYPIIMGYVISVEDSLGMAGLKSVALNLTEYFNLIYTPVIPTGCSDAVIKIGFDENDLSEIKPEEDGTYRFDDILPHQMGDTIYFRMEGTIANTVPFSYDMTYSVKQYCMNMLAKATDNKELCDLLRDILTYGAAAQVYQDYKTDALVNADITDREFRNEALSGVYAGEIVGSKTGAARWISGSLILENVTNVKFKFAAADVTDLKVIIAKNTGEKLVYTSDMFEDEGTDDTTGDQLYSISIPMMAYEYSTGLVAAFSTDGSDNADMSHYLIYSVNTYVARMYGQTDNADLDALLGAIYNYGESTRAYVATLN